MTTPYSYAGSELELFKNAANWKSYFHSRLMPYLGEDVLEVGAGIGSTTRHLCYGREKRWICLEGDARLADRLKQAIARGELPSCCQSVAGTTEQVNGTSLFDTVLYIDVLEHIRDDRGEIDRAARRLKPKGHLLVLAPAHPALYSPFDRGIGHYRRYTRKSLSLLAPPQLEPVWLGYLDSIGLLASVGNRLILRSRMPTPLQIAIWDRLLIPLSRVIDPLLAYRVGKSVLVVWRKKTEGSQC